MKNIIFYTLSILLVLASCQPHEEINNPVKRKGFDVNIVIDELQTGPNTRSSIPSEPGEKDVNSLYLAIFDYDKNGEGNFVGCYEVSTGNLKTNSVVTIPPTFGNNVIIDSEKDYTILAFANLEETSPGAKDGFTDDFTDFLDDFQNQTENTALQAMMAHVSDVGTDETDNTKAIKSNNLFMSSRAIRPAGETQTTINLKRGVSRFDVRNDAITHKLVSVSIWGAAFETPVWEGVPIQYEQTQRFYGVQSDGNEEIKGKLYAFENTVLEPAHNDKETTCLIIGLKPNDAENTLYYRVNVHLKDSHQNLLRNNSYQVIIKSVTGEGSKTEYEAWTHSRNELLVSINSWNLDDNGMILTDGTNALGLTVKNIILDPKGDIREYSLYTSGTGVLEITRSDLPLKDGSSDPAFIVTLEGNLLRVTAGELPTGKDVLRGSIEVSFAGLRGNINIIQQPNNNKFLSLDRVEIPEFAFSIGSAIVDGPLLVTSSGPWIAEIYNTDDSNPGFSFQPNGNLVVKIESEENPSGESFQIYTMEENNSGYNRNSFVIVYLADDPDNYSVAVPLIQQTVPVLEVSPTISVIRFHADKKPVNTDIAKGDLYEFTVNSGNQGWSVEVTGKDYDKFEVKKEGNNLTVEAKSLNSTTEAFTANILVKSGNNEINIPVVQQVAVLSLRYSGQIPTAGGELAVNVSSSGMAWNAEIIENWNPGSENKHEAWLDNIGEGGNQILTNQTKESFHVSFKALTYPFVNLTPRATVKVSLSAIPDISQTIEIIQLPFKPTTLRVMDVKTTSYGALTSASYFAGYVNFLKNTSLFGPSGIVKVPAISITEVRPADDPGDISSEYRYLHAGGNPRTYDSNRFISVENWRTQNDGVVVFASDSDGDQFENASSTLKILGYTPANPVFKRPATINVGLLNSENTWAKNIMNYLLNDGPFGVVNNPESITFTNDATCVSLQTYADGVPAILNGNGNALLVIDPKNRLVYIGESQMFSTGYNTSIRSDKDRFLGNLLSYILNAAMNGSAFTNIFSDDTRYNERFKQ